MMFQYDWKGWKLVTASWFIFISILFFLPGTAFPKQNWLSDIHFDKWVHFGLFFLLTFFSRFLLYPLSGWRDLMLLFFLLLYAVLIELIQDALIVNRSLDMWDAVADMAGASAGLFVWWQVYKKNKPL